MIKFILGVVFGVLFSKDILHNRLAIAPKNDTPPNMVDPLLHLHHNNKDRIIPDFVYTVIG